MTATLSPLPKLDKLSNPSRVKFTRDVCEKLVSMGFLQEPYELIDGEVISTMGQNPLHCSGMRRVTRWLAEVFGLDYVSSQLTLEVLPEDRLHSAPLPDAFVTSKSFEAFDKVQPQPKDVLLLIEVADASRSFDLSTKAALYARSSITEYWVLDMVKRCLVVHLQPTIDGYRSVLTYDEHEALSPQSKPDAVLTPSLLLPPAE